MKVFSATIFALMIAGGFAGCGEGQNSTPDMDVSEGKAASVQLYARLKSDEIRLTWTTDEYADGYLLEWGKRADSLDHSEVFGRGENVFIHQELASSTLYYYRLTILLDDGNKGDSSAVVSVRTGSRVAVRQSDVAI